MLAQRPVGVHGLTNGVEERSSPLLLSNHVDVWSCCLSVVGARSKLLVDGSSSSLVGVLGAEENALDDGVGQKEEAVNVGVSGMVMNNSILEKLTMQGS